MKIKSNNRSIGWDGVITLIVSNCLIIMSFGISLLWFFIKVYSIAKSSGTDSSDTSFQFILIPGVKLENNKINLDFSQRLNRALKLFYKHKEQQKLIVLGGVTHNNTISEAEAGADYLFQQNINQKNVILENASRHTLENLSNARKIIDFSPSLIVSNRYHLYRISCLASGLKLNVYLIAAEEQFKLSIKMLLDCLREAYFIHWYFAGKLWLTITRNKFSHARIS